MKGFLVHTNPEIVDWITVPIRGGRIRIPMSKSGTDMWTQVGDRQVPVALELQLREADAPAIDVMIEIINHVPRVTSLNVWRYGDGREVRKRDLDLDLEGLVEQAVAIVSTPLEDDGDAVRRMPSALGGAPQDVELIRHGVNAVRNARKRSQRVMTPERMKRVAEVYQAQETGGLDAVAAAFNVHRTTAYRWITKAREAGLLPAREDGN